MDAVNSAGVNTNYGSYTEYEPASAGASAETGSAAAGSAVDDSSIGSFVSDRGAGEVSDLYGRKAQAESELGGITAQKNEAQTRVNARRLELTQNRQDGEEFAAENEGMSSLQETYAQTVSARDEAQQALNQAKQESCANDQAISSNAQQRQSVSAQLSSLQSQLASLQPPANSGGGEDGEANANYEAEYSAYEAQKSALETQIAELQQQLQELQSESQQLQNTKAQLDRELSSKQSEVLQLDAALQAAQSALDEYFQNKVNEDSGLENDLAVDGDLRDLQSELQSLQQQEAEKQAEVAEINEQIAAAEANDEGLQTVREEAADRAFREAAEQTGFDADGAEAAARSAAAQEEYGKPYEELTEEEKLSIEARVDGEVTLEAMDLARQKLEEDPDNAAAQAVIERGAKSLDAQAQLAQTRFNNSMENLPESLREGAAAAMSEARNNAAEGADPEAAAMEALTRYIADNSDSADLSPEELAALESIVGAAGDYADALDTADRGADIVEAASESFAQSELAAMKADAAARLGVSPDQLIVLSGTDADDEIIIANSEDGGLRVTINGGEPVCYTAEEAKYLIIDGGAGNDEIYPDEDVENHEEDVSRDLHIFGGSGDDTVWGMYGNNILYGGAGNDTIYGGVGNDVLVGGSGDDYLEGDDGNDILLGGDGNDEIEGGEGNDLIDGSTGDDTIQGGNGDDIIDGGAGSDKIYGDRKTFQASGNDIIMGGDGDDWIEGGKGNDFIDGGDGNDVIHGGDEYYKYSYEEISYRYKEKSQEITDIIHRKTEEYLAISDKDVILGGSGNDRLYGEKDNDLLLGEGGRDQLLGGDGDDIMDGGEGADALYDYDSNNCFFVDSSDETSMDSHIFIDGLDEKTIQGVYRNSNRPGITREDIFAKIAAGSEVEFSIDDANSLKDAMLGLYEANSDWIQPGKTAISSTFASCKCMKGVYDIYQTGKLGAFTYGAGALTGIGGGFSLGFGMWEAYQGYQSGDQLQYISGMYKAVAGEAAILAACFPVAAPGLLIVSGVYSLCGLGVDLWRSIF